jgi:hypothetical protein
MSRHESDREDLFAEGTALTTRIELMLPGETDPVVAGCRPTGAWSIYFGGDPCYHFDAEGRLRRSFAGGYLYRTQGDTLARLQRTRTAEEVVLERTDLRPEYLSAFMQRMRLKLNLLQDALSRNAAEIRRQVPEGADVLAQLSAVVATILSQWPKLSPAIPTRRN